MFAFAPARSKAAIAFILVTAVLDIVAMGIIIPVLPQLIEEFAGSNANAGWINGVFVAPWAGMQFVASPIIGSLSDRYGRRPSPSGGVGRRRPSHFSQAMPERRMTLSRMPD